MNNCVLSFCAFIISPMPYLKDKILALDIAETFFILIKTQLFIKHLKATRLVEKRRFFSLHYFFIRIILIFILLCLLLFNYCSYSFKFYKKIIRIKVDSRNFHRGEKKGVEFCVFFRYYS